VIFVFVSVYMMYYIYRFVYVEPSLHPCNEAYFVMVCDLFNAFLNLGERQILTTRPPGKGFIFEFGLQVF
jgi:hypothetical protein